MGYSTEPANIWALLFPPAKTEVAQSTKKTYVTNYVKGKGQSQNDISLPQIATGGIAPFVLGHDLIKDPDMMWYGNLKPKSKSVVSQEVITHEDGSQTISTTITTTVVGYTVDVQFCLGLGPGTRLRAIRVDGVAIWTGTVGPVRSTFTVSGNATITDVIFAGGNFDQAVDPYIQGLVDQVMTGYRGIAYIVLKSLDTTKLTNISFEVDRYPDPLGLGIKNKIGEDLNVASAMAEIITSKWGGAGRDIATLGASFTTLGNLCYDEGNGCSIVNRQVVSANDLNSILTDQTETTMWVDYETGKIEVTPYRKNFDRTNLVRLFDRDITKMDDLTKSGWPAIPTSISAKYFDRSQDYAEIPLRARNLAASSKLSKSNNEQSYPAVRTGTLAAQLLARDGATAGSPMQQIQLTTNRKAARVNPGDIILITYEDYKYYSVPAIVLKRRTQPVDDNSVTLVCNVVLYPNNNVLFAAPEPSFFVSLDPDPHAPVGVLVKSTPQFMRQTYTYSGAGPDYLTGTAIDYPADVPFVMGEAYNQSQTNMGGYYDNGGVETRFYAGVTVPITPGIDFGYPLFGKLTGAIDKYDHWDGSQITISLHTVNRNVTDYEDIVAAINLVLGQTALIWIDDEIFVFDHSRDYGTTSATIDMGLRTLVLTGCRRAYGDTVAQSHAANSDVFVTSNAPTVKFMSKLTFAYGVTPDFKFVGASFPKNVYTLSSISTALSYSGYTASDRARRPLRPHNTKIAGSRGTSAPTALVRGATAAISWKVRSRIRQSAILTPSFQTDANQVGEVHSGNHIVYRVMIIDSAAVSWDCGTTSAAADTDNLTITIPAGAAAGVGWLYVQAEFDAGGGTRVSGYQDRLPITLS